MNGPPHWNYFDTAYTLTGCLIVAPLLWARLDLNAAFWVGLLLVVTYAAGRAAGSHR